MSRRRPLKERFWEKVDKSAGPKNCWVWIGHKTEGGYGQINSGKHGMKGAHVISYIWFKGKVKKGTQVCHSCDNRSCVNPKHLWIGTPKENIQDAVKKKRMTVGERHFKAKKARMTTKKVIKILDYSNRGVVQSKIAKKFGITQGAVSHIVCKRNWKHLETTNDL